MIRRCLACSVFAGAWHALTTLQGLQSKEPLETCVSVSLASANGHSQQVHSLCHGEAFQVSLSLDSESGSTPSIGHGKIWTFLEDILWDMIVNGSALSFLSWCGSRVLRCTTPAVGPEPQHTPQTVQSPRNTQQSCHPNRSDVSLQVFRKKLVRRHPPSSQTLAAQFRSATEDHIQKAFPLAVGGTRSHYKSEEQSTEFEMVMDPDIAPHCLFASAACIFGLPVDMSSILALRQITFACLTAAHDTMENLLGSTVKVWAVRSGYSGTSNFLEDTLTIRPGSSLDLAILAAALDKDYLLVDSTGMILAQTRGAALEQGCIMHHRDHFTVVRPIATRVNATRDISATLEYPQQQCVQHAVSEHNSPQPECTWSPEIIDYVHTPSCSHETALSPPPAQDCPVDVWDDCSHTIHRVPSNHHIATNACPANTQSADPVPFQFEKMTDSLNLVSSSGKRGRKGRRKRKHQEVESPRTQTESPENSDVEHLAEHGLILNRQGVAVNGDETVAVVVHRHMQTQMGALIKAYQRRQAATSATTATTTAADAASSTRTSSATKRAIQGPPKQVYPGAFMIHFSSQSPTVESLKMILKKRLRYHINKLLVKVDEEPVPDTTRLTEIVDAYISYETNKAHIPDKHRRGKTPSLAAQQDSEDRPEAVEEPDTEHASSDDSKDDTTSSRASRSPAQAEQLRLLRGIAEDTSAILRLLRDRTITHSRDIYTGGGREDEELLSRAALRRAQACVEGTLPDTLLQRLLKAEKRNVTTWIKASTNVQLLASISAACKRTGALREAEAVDAVIIKQRAQATQPSQPAHQQLPQQQQQQQHYTQIPAQQPAKHYADLKTGSPPHTEASASQYASALEVLTNAVQWQQSATMMIVQKLDALTALVCTANDEHRERTTALTKDFTGYLHALLEKTEIIANSHGMMEVLSYGQEQIWMKTQAMATLIEDIATCLESSGPSERPATQQGPRQRVQQAQRELSPPTSPPTPESTQENRTDLQLQPETQTMSWSSHMLDAPLQALPEHIVTEVQQQIAQARDDHPEIKLYSIVDREDGKKEWSTLGTSQDFQLVASRTLDQHDQALSSHAAFLEKQDRWNCNVERSLCTVEVAVQELRQMSVDSPDQQHVVQQQQQPQQQATPKKCTETPGIAVDGYEATPDRLTQVSSPGRLMSWISQQRPHWCRSPAKHPEAPSYTPQSTEENGKVSAELTEEARLAGKAVEDGIISIPDDESDEQVPVDESSS
eukprot:6490951-Amphidinium_carterae.1